MALSRGATAVSVLVDAVCGRIDGAWGISFELLEAAARSRKEKGNYVRRRDGLLISLGSLRIVKCESHGSFSEIASRLAGSKCHTSPALL